jgi:protoporphyrinogen oxidase
VRMHSVPRTVGIIGGGALGLTAAYDLAKLGIKVTIIERGDQLGGLATAFKIGDSHLEKFYHHLFATDRDITRLIEEVGMSEDLLWPRPSTSVFYNGNAYRLDSPIDVLRFSPLGLVDRLRLGVAIAYLKLLPTPSILEGRTANEWIQTWMGDRAYTVIWRPMFEQKFGDRYTQVSMPWFWARLHFRTAKLGYLRGGFIRLYAELAKRIEQMGGTIRTNSAVERVESDENGVVIGVAGGHLLKFDAVLATLPTRLFIRLTPSLPAEYVQQYDWGEAYSAQCLILELDRNLLDQVYWLSIHDPGYPFLVVVDHTNYMSAKDYGGSHPVYFGNYLPPKHRLLGLTDRQILDEFEPFIKKINPLFNRNWIRRMHLFTAPFAQPIVTTDFVNHIPPHDTPLPNVFLANMFQVYPQDRGQNYSVRMAHRVVKLIAESIGL